jgi:hypothetical protein
MEGLMFVFAQISIIPAYVLTIDKCQGLIFLGVIIGQLL